MIDFLLLAVLLLVIGLNHFTVKKWKVLATETTATNRKAKDILEGMLAQIKDLQTENLTLYEDKLELLTRVKALLLAQKDTENQKIH